MPDFVQLWVYLSSTPLFGLTATLVTYVVAQAIYARLGHTPLANPVLWSVIVIGVVLWITRTPYPTYFAGAQFIHVMLGPAVVALAWPLYQRGAEVRRRGRALVTAALVGGVAAGGSAVALAWLCGLPAEVVKSLAPKSVTAPVAMGIAERLGGVPALAAVFAVLDASPIVAANPDMSRNIPPFCSAPSIGPSPVGSGSAVGFTMFSTGCPS